MTQKPDDGGEKPQLKVSMLKDKEQRTGTSVEWRRYATPIAVVIVGIVIVAAILLRRIDVVPIQTTTNTPVEVGTIQAQQTSLALLITPSLDPNVSALQTQNALLAQSGTNLAATSQALAAQPTQTPQVLIATTQPPAVQPTQNIAVPPTQLPTVIPPTQPPTQAAAGCSPGDVASLPARPDATVNNTTVTTQVRDNNACVRPLFYNETGIAKGTNYTLDLPQGWAAITASTTAEIQSNGGQAHQYLDTPVIVVHGPYNGGIGLYEGAIRIVPEEWVQSMLDTVMSIQRTQTNKPDLQPIVFSEQGGGTVATVSGQSGLTVCSPAKVTDYPSATTVKITGRAIVHPWWNNGRPSWGQEQVRLLLKPGQTVTFVDMLGKVYAYENTAACEAIMTSEFANATFRVVTVDELVQQGLATVQAGS